MNLVKLIWIIPIVLKNYENYLILHSCKLDQINSNFIINLNIIAQTVSLYFLGIQERLILAILKSLLIYTKFDFTKFDPPPPVVQAVYNTDEHS